MIAEVIVNSNVKNLNRTFDYLVPIELEKEISVGSRVFMPFGNKKELEEGYVINIKDYSEFDESKLKSIVKIEEETYLDEDKINLAKWISKYYFCNLSDSLKLMFPPGKTAKRIENRINDKMQNFIYLLKDEEEIFELIENNKVKSEKQLRVLKFLLDNNSDNEMISSLDVQLFADVDSSVLRALEKKGIIEISKQEVLRNPFENRKEEKDKRTKKLTLNKEQKEAFLQIEESIEDNLFTKYLLFGITGSGKTEVYLQAIEKVIKENKTCIMLVPEISLTPQTIDRFISRFGRDDIAVLHSKLSVGERYDEWKRIYNGDAKIVIGARSAIFAPLKNIGLIIMDEEHDDSYKSEMSPRYDAKEVAEFIAKANNCPLVLGSATPDMDTYYKALNGEIVLLELSKRANNSNLPEVEIVDLREELSKGNKSMISDSLRVKIEENIKNKKQTILFLNRRGFSSFVMCRDCGYTLKCKNCDITLTYHSYENKMKCHYCGLEERVSKTCPNCGSENIRYFGTGTQKLESQIKEIFPEASVIRMDIDTVSKKNSHEEIIDEFKDNNIDILIGTQMVVKGHHFPNVTLVGVIAADTSLNIDDYRASEKTFQTITQVAGRAGRDKEKGYVVVQTYNPDNYSILDAKDQDYKEFYNQEIGIRKALRYPPFCDIILLGISSKNLNRAKETSYKLFSYIKDKLKNQSNKENSEGKVNLICYKPLPAPIEKIKNRYRWRIIIKCIYDENMNKFLKDVNDYILNENKNDKYETRVIIDVDPRNML